MLPCAAVFLCIKTAQLSSSGVSAVKASYEISALSKDLHCEDYTPASADTVTFTGSSSRWGWRQFILLDQLRPAGSPYLSNNRLLLRVTNLTVLNTVAAGHSGFWGF